MLASVFRAASFVCVLYTSKGYSWFSPPYLCTEVLCALICHHQCLTTLNGICCRRENVIKKFSFPLGCHEISSLKLRIDYWAERRIKWSLNVPKTLQAKMLSFPIQLHLSATLWKTSFMPTRWCRANDIHFTVPIKHHYTNHISFRSVSKLYWGGCPLCPCFNGSVSW